MPNFSDTVMIPTIQVRDGCVLLYRVQDVLPKRNKVEFRKPAYGGRVTLGAQKRIASALDIFLQTTDERVIFNTVTQRHMNFRLGLATLTITDPCEWKADKCYTCLFKPWLRVMKEKYGVKRYMWKYELQKRGNVHYHIAWDEFVAHDKIRQVWNRQQHKHGLTDKYAARYKNFNPNSTDIHKVWHVQNIGAYLGKYLQKGESQDADVKGKVWDCSIDLKRKRYSTEFVWENDDLLKDLLGRGQAKVIHSENCTIVKCSDPMLLLTDEQKTDYILWKYQI